MNPCAECGCVGTHTSGCRKGQKARGAKNRKLHRNLMRQAERQAGPQFVEPVVPERKTRKVWLLELTLRTDTKVPVAVFDRSSEGRRQATVIAGQHYVYQLGPDAKLEGEWMPQDSIATEVWVLRPRSGPRDTHFTLLPILEVIHA